MYYFIFLSVLAKITDVRRVRNWDWDSDNNCHRSHKKHIFRSFFVRV